MKWSICWSTASPCASSPPHPERTLRRCNFCAYGPMNPPPSMCNAYSHAYMHEPFLCCVIDWQAGGVVCQCTRQLCLSVHASADMENGGWDMCPLPTDPERVRVSIWGKAAHGARHKGEDRHLVVATNRCSLIGARNCTLGPSQRAVGNRTRHRLDPTPSSLV